MAGYRDIFTFFPQGARDFCLIQNLQTDCEAYTATYLMANKDFFTEAALSEGKIRPLGVYDQKRMYKNISGLSAIVLKI
jgi:hypothetical protein